MKFTRATDCCALSQEEEVRHNMMIDSSEQKRRHPDGVSKISPRAFLGSTKLPYFFVHSIPEGTPKGTNTIILDATPSYCLPPSSIITS